MSRGASSPLPSTRCALLFLAAFLLAWTAPSTASTNVLFIAVDDLNDWVGCLGGHPLAKTPHIDRLAQRGTVFLNAHCQAPLCNPSRASVLTGLRPSTTGIYALAPGIREVAELRQHITLPQTFTRAGYFTAAFGKIYHDQSIAPADHPAEFSVWGPAPPMPKPSQRLAKLPGKPHPLMDWGSFPADDQEQADWKVASATIEALNSAPSDKPFFIACGFRLPHVPCFASSKWFDLYPDDDSVLPLVREEDRDDTPLFSWYLHWRLPEPRLSTLRQAGEWRPLVRAYLASISFMDSQVGRLLDALDKTGRADETLIVLWSDHGWHLGEKLITGKNTLWERSTRVPLVFAGPGVIAGGRCQRPVELLDIFPTLLELCHLPARTDLEGHNLTGLLTDPTGERLWPAITTHNAGNHTIRTERWRYIRYADRSDELYDMQSDPHEWTNLVQQSQAVSIIPELTRWLPKSNHPPVPGSKDRLLIYDPKTSQATWEGEVIDPLQLER